LALAHKTGFVCLVILPVVRIAALLYPRRRPILCLSLLLLAFVVSLVIAPVRFVGAPVGSVVGWIYFDLVRFAWIRPALLLAAIMSPRAVFRPSAPGFMWLALLVTFPVAHHMEMYLAMMALPFVVYTGVVALRVLSQHLPGTNVQHVRAVLLLSLLGALAIVVQRSIKAMPHRVYLAARHIERIDPYGPFEIVSPWRTLIQGTVTGCPRFTVVRDGDAGVSIKAPPRFTANPRQFAYEWESYLRWIFQTGTTADWYGSPQTRYHVLPAGDPPPDPAALIYNRRGIAIYREQRQ
jgi:hypothetical protein